MAHRAACAKSDRSQQKGRERTSAEVSPISEKAKPTEARTRLRNPEDSESCESPKRPSAQRGKFKVTITKEQLVVR